MHRFYIDPSSWNLDALILGPEETHHCVDVLRVREGDRVVVFNGLGVEATAEILRIDKKSVELRRQHFAKTPRLSCEITLGQAIPRGKNMDLIVQKATELGAHAIAPLVSERTVTQFDRREADRKREKWQTVAIEAAKQCGQNWLPRVHVPQTPKSFFESGHKFGLMLIASLQADALDLKEVLADHFFHHGLKPSSVLILVGPEGDFTPAESSLAKGWGCRPITLGPIVLRTETAALYCLSVLSYEMLTEHR
jgi:16S rRNA (uracil1498-N3)-methyltransferase